MITLKSGGLSARLCAPGEYYLGTRFDRAGVFRKIEKDGYVFADEWFTGSAPDTHDHVCGLSGEFVTVDFGSVPPGGLFCKVGVGLLRRPDEAAYDWFRLYEIADPGRWSVEAGESEVIYRHILEGWYSYSRRIVLSEGCRIDIFHELSWHSGAPLEGFYYNHNFLTFGGLPVGPVRSLLFPWSPDGDWRSDYDNVAFSRNGIQFSDTVKPGTSVYCGNIHNPSGPTSCRFVLSDGERSVSVEGDRPLHRLVFWANEKVACPEPYIPIRASLGDTLSWHLSYTFR